MRQSEGSRRNREAEGAPSALWAEGKKVQGRTFFTKFVPLWALPVLVAMAIGTVWLRLSIVRTSYSIDQMDRQLRALHQAKQEMELKVTGLRSPRRLELLAKTRLNMSAPQPAQVIRMRTDDVLKSATAAERTDEAGDDQ